MMHCSSGATILVAALLSVSVSCSGPRHAAPFDTAQGAAAAASQAIDTSGNATREPGALGTVTATPVVGWLGPGDRPFEVTQRTEDPSTALSRRFGNITLRVSARVRTPNLGQFPCTSCHLGQRLSLSDTRRKATHENIKPVHPAQTGGACSTCHSSANVELLALKSGERATLDHTYRLCAQCHFAQAKAWAGGGHGKRLDGWQGRRVLMGCADCHDPHKPAVEPRIPFRAPQLERPRGHTK